MELAGRVDYSNIQLPGRAGDVVVTKLVSHFILSTLESLCQFDMYGIYMLSACRLVVSDTRRLKIDMRWTRYYMTCLGS